MRENQYQCKNNSNEYLYQNYCCPYSINMAKTLFSSYNGFSESVSDIEHFFTETRATYVWKTLPFLKLVALEPKQ